MVIIPSAHLKENLTLSNQSNYFSLRFRRAGIIKNIGSILELIYYVSENCDEYIIALQTPGSDDYVDQKSAVFLP